MKQNNVIKKEFFYPSANGINDIFTLAYIPSGQNKGFIQIVHDLYEHIDCYDEVLQHFAEEGYIAFGNDHIGHGKSVNDVADLGKISDGSTITDFVEDTRKAFLILLNEYAPEVYNDYQIEEKTNKKVVIHAMIGIGFGSAVLKNYVILFNDVNCACFIGDCGFPLNKRISYWKCKQEIRKCGEKSPADNLVKFVEKGYLKNKDSSYRFNWITRNKKYLSKYKHDDLCQFEYDLKSYKLILQMYISMNLSEWAKSYPPYLATVILTGKQDPTYRQVDLANMVNMMKDNKCKNVFIRYYDGYHNVLFETFVNTVYADILSIINAVRKQQYSVKKSEEK